MLNTPLDQLGITVCSVGGTNFAPYAKFLTALKIPFAIVTDWDPRGEDQDPLGYNRTLGLVSTIEKTRTGAEPTELLKELRSIEDINEFCVRCEQFGVFSNIETLEVDLFRAGYAEAIIDILREAAFGPARTARIDAWEADHNALGAKKLLSMVEDIGKGRFAQRLASRMSNIKVPSYIRSAIRFVADRV